MSAPLQARRLALIWGALLTATPSYAKPLPEALRDARAHTHAPAATAAVYHCGRRVWSGASGVKSLHTSGLREYTYSKRPRRDRVLASIGRPRFAPGTRYAYTNANYVVLGGILEKVTGTSVESIFRRRVASRLRMEKSSFRYRPRRSASFAESYYSSGESSWVPGVGIPSDTWGEVWTDGGLASTAPETARFLDGLIHLPCS